MLGKKKEEEEDWRESLENVWERWVEVLNRVMTCILFKKELFETGWKIGMALVKHMPVGNVFQAEDVFQKLQGRPSDWTKRNKKQKIWVKGTRGRTQRLAWNDLQHKIMQGYEQSDIT